jgi:hypothetical protein
LFVPFSVCGCYSCSKIRLGNSRSCTGDIFAFYIDFLNFELEGNIITAENHIKARKCYAILRKEIIFCLDGLKNGMPSKRLIEIYATVLQICKSETRTLEKYFIKKIRRGIINDESIKLSLYLELCNLECTMNFENE